MRRMCNRIYFKSTCRQLSCVIVFFFSLLNSYAQDSIIECSDSAYCVPGVSGLPRSKGLIIERVNTFDHGIVTRTPEGEVISREEIQKNRIYNFKARGPIVNKPQLKMVLGASVSLEEFAFEDVESISDPLLTSLEDRPLRTVGVDLYTIKSFRGNKYMVSRLQTRLNGDFDNSISPIGNYLRFDFVTVLGWKLDNHRSFGAGLAFSHIYGKASILPVIIYYNSFSPHWGIEANLPANARLRFSPDKKHSLYAGASIKGANYRLEPTETSAPYILEKSELNMGIELEREVHDWLWMGFKCGYRKNLSMEVSSNSNLSLGTNNRIVETDVSNSFYYGVSIFIVPPRKLKKYNAE